MDEHEYSYLHALNLVPQVGQKTLRTLREHFGSFASVWEANAGELAECGIFPPAVAALIEHRPHIDPEKEFAKLAQANIWMIAEDSDVYPELLKEIPNPPAALYGKGAVEALTAHSIAIALVGTRRTTRYGIEVAELLAHELAEAGITVVSGLATGIDATAHTATLERKGTTIGILGSGLDRASFFPRENWNLSERIIKENGVVVSEYPPGTPPLKEHFPQRNRIVSGICKGIVVVEAREKSGALITARFALEHNRQVFAVPGSIFSPTARGANLLIQEGAKLILSTADILVELGITPAATLTATRDTLSEADRMLLDLLEEPQTIDTLKQAISGETAPLIASLSLLELQGRVRNLGAGTYQRIM
ncbi:MAG: DNA-processing protein DprA [bacterium]|nr:DNA-processing protein DprA [bacterium]MDZ4299381.1 DNA-processing protein DprA [Candidatus Sungbacteria bacterium]